MATLEENINQAIADFDDIEAAIKEKGVEVADGTDTSEYGNLIRGIPVGGDSPIQYIESDSSNPIYLREIDSGTYVLYGKFKPFNGSTGTFTFSTGMLVSIIKTTSITYVQVFYSKNNTIQYLEITDEEYTRKDAKLVDMETKANLTSVVDENSDDTHYPSAKAVYNAMELKRIESLDTENMKYMRDIENGYYIMHGYFQPYPNSDYTVVMDTMCVSVVRVDEGSHLMAFSPLNFKIRCYEILVDDTAEDGFVFNSWVINLLELQDLIEKVGNLEEQTSTKQETANALKANASGGVIRVDDVSPVEHNAKISVRGRNLFDIAKVPITGGSTKISVTEVGANYIVVTSESGYNSNGFCSTGVTLSQLCPQLREGDTVTLNAESPSIMNCIYLDTTEIADSATRFWHFGNGRVVTKEMLNAVVCVYGLNAIQGDGIGECTISNIQIKDSDTATEYEPYIDPASVTLYRCGKNLFDVSNTQPTIVNVEVNEETGNKYTLKGSLGNNAMAYSAGAARFMLSQGVKNPDKITVSLYVTLLEQGSYDNRLRIWSVNKNKEAIQYVGFNLTLNVREKITAVFDTQTEFLSGITFYLNNNKVLLEIDTLQVEIGDTATEYAEYDSINCVPNADGTAEILSASPTMTLFTNTEGANIEIEYNQDTNTVMDNVKKDIREIDRVISELSKGSSNVLTDTKTGKNYRLYVEDGKLSMEVIE